MEQATQVRHGTDESAAWFRGKLVELGITQADLARLLISYGDDRTLDNILRQFRRMASGDARVNGEMRALLNHLGVERRNNLERAERLDCLAESLRNRWVTQFTGGQDVTDEALGDAERQREELRNLPVPFRA